MTTSRRRVTRGFSVGEEKTPSSEVPVPRRVRTREQIMKGEGRRPPAAVQLSALAHNPFNPRESLTDVEETAASLKVRGQLQPVAVVRRAAFLAVHPDQEGNLAAAEYVVIDGNRRLAAAPVAGLVELRIDVNDDLASSADDILESALIANIHRVDVPPIDQAKAIKQLVASHGSQEEVARRLGKSGAWVSQRLALLELPEDLQEKVTTGELPVKEGRRIGRLPAEKQHGEAEEVLNRVKAPRKPRSAKTSKAGDPPGKLEAQSGADTGTAAAPEQEGDSVGTATLNPVKDDGSAEAAPDLPWEDPAWFDRMLREHMSPVHRATLAGLLQAGE